MLVLKKACNNLANSIRFHVKDIDDDKFEVISYGLYIVIGDLIKIIITLSLAYLLGIFKYIIIAMTSFGILRSFAGGVHAKSWASCLISNMSISFGIVYLSMFLAKFYVLTVSVILFPITFASIYAFAPSDHENKPIASKKQIKKLRIFSFIILLAEYSIALITKDTTISHIIMLSTLSIGIAILPITYKITGNKHGDLTSFMQQADSNENS